jgi:subtilisin family serine protease
MTPENKDWPVGPTGRFLVTLREGSESKLRLFGELAGRAVTSSADSKATVDFLRVGNTHAAFYEHVGIAVVDADPRSVQRLQSAVFLEDHPVLAVEPEQYGHALGLPFSDNAYSSWGLQATGAATSSASASGIRLAVLDSGIDLGHPEFIARRPLLGNFAPGTNSVQDMFGHGTHVAGTCCGRRAVSSASPGYGIANDALLMIGKVLNDSGWYQDEWLIAGINWALDNQAQIISMSLGARLVGSPSYVTAYEQVGKRALAAGCLIVAAAGNSENEPVYSPANCPSILAVGALDRSLGHASFSSIGINHDGGDIDIAAPGVDVFSTYPMPDRTYLLSGTSMAAPHVAGCAALWAGATGLRGEALWKKLLQTARPIGLPKEQAGAGLVQAPP